MPARYGSQARKQRLSQNWLGYLFLCLLYFVCCFFCCFFFYLLLVLSPLQCTCGMQCKCSRPHLPSSLAPRVAAASSPPPSVASTLPVQFYCQPPPLHAAEILQQFLTDLKSFVRKLRAFRVTLEFTGLTLIYIHIYSKIKKQNKSTLTYHIITYDTCGKYQKTLELIAGTKWNLSQI